MLATLMAWLLLGLSSVTWAKTISVPGTAATIKGAMRQATAGDIILVSGGTYHEHGIDMVSGVALWSGTLQPNCVTIDAQNKGPIFLFTQADTNTALVGFTLQGGLAPDTNKGRGGSIRLQKSSPRISNCIFQNNSASSGGAVFADAGSRPVFSNCIFQNNDATFTGGALFLSGSARISQCTFENNTALAGGALSGGPGSSLLLAQCIVQNNAAGNTGGALYLQGGRAEISQCIFASNSGGLGGAVVSSHTGDLAMERSTLYGNLADTDGGVLAFRAGRPVISNSIIAHSQSPVLRPDSGTPHFSGCNLFGNEGGDWSANLRTFSGKHGNISRDPLFCAPESGNFSLRDASACLPDHNPSGNKDLVGALGPGCASVLEHDSPGKKQSAGFSAVKAGF